MQEGEGDERVEGVGDELLLWKYEVVVLELIFPQEVGDHDCGMLVAKSKPWKKPRQRAVGARD